MNRKLLAYILASAVFLIAVPATQALAQEKPVKIGYVDLKRVYEESGKKALYDEQMKDMDRDIRLKLNKIESDITRNKRMLLEMSEDKRDETEKAIRDGMQQLREYQAQAQKDIQAKSREFELEFAKELKDIMTAIGEKEGYTYILSDLVILYSDEAHDLTEAAIKAFKKEEKKPAKSGKGD